MGRIDVEEEIEEEVHNSQRSGSVSRTVQCSKGNSSDDDDGLYNKVHVQVHKSDLLVVVVQWYKFEVQQNQVQVQR